MSTDTQVDRDRYLVRLVFLERASQHSASLGNRTLISDPKRRTVLRMRLAPIVKPRRRHVRMPRPFLQIGDVGYLLLNGSSHY
jgi:hypothetical protein